jgi:hypothetical protein
MTHPIQMTIEEFKDSERGTKEVKMTTGISLNDS